MSTDRPQTGSNASATPSPSVAPAPAPAPVPAPAPAAGPGTAPSSSTPPVPTRVVQVTRTGGPEVLAVRDVELAPPGAGEVLVRVEAAGVAFGDVLLRVGMRRVPLPAVPGHEVVGTVAAVGADVEGLAVGDPVAAYTQAQGGYATFVVAPAWAVLPRPAHLDPHAVVSLVLNYVTAWQMLTRTAVIAEGSTVLVQGAAGGVGSALVQLAVLRGLRVIGTASTGKVDRVRQMGATAIDHRTSDVAAEVRALAPDGVDAIFDGLGSASWRADLPLLRTGGHLVIYGMSSAFAGGNRNLGALARNFARLPRTSYLTYVTRGIGVTAYNNDAMVAAHHDWFRADLAALLDLLDAGAITPLVHATFPLEQAGRAQDELGSGRAVGKVTLAVSQS